MCWSHRCWAWPPSPVSGEFWKCTSSRIVSRRVGFRATPNALIRGITIMVMPSMNRVNKRIKKYKNMKTYRFLALSLAVAALSLTSAAKVENFEVNQVFKTGQSVFHILDQNAEQDTYTMASVALQWPLRFGDNDLTALQDSLLMLTFGETGNPDEVIENYLQHPQGYGDKVLDLIDDLPAEAVGLLEK